MKQNESLFTLATAEPNVEYQISAISTDDAELEKFLFTLGCFANEPITILSILSGQLVITIKDARYSIDRDLAKTIVLKPLP